MSDGETSEEIKRQWMDHI